MTNVCAEEYLKTHPLVCKIAAEYLEAPVWYEPWNRFKGDIFTLNDKGEIPQFTLSFAQNPYKTTKELHEDYKVHKSILVSARINFTYDHPFNTPTITAYLARAWHDKYVHIEQSLGFGIRDELWGAVQSRYKLSDLGQAAQWTDDVAISCVKLVTGNWPQVQAPVICVPRWQQLKELLSIVT